MSELNNPLFEEEKEFLERKKLEYERALRGDVEHIKGQSVMAGKVALVGAGLAGGIWLITKAFSGKKRRKHSEAEDEQEQEPEPDHFEDQAEEQYVSTGTGKRFKAKVYKKSARDSAAVFAAAHSHEGDVDDLGFGGAAPASAPRDFSANAFMSPDSVYDSADDDPFQDLPYDDSRRLAASHAFDDSNDMHEAGRGLQTRGPSLVGAALQGFLQSDTGKVIVAQVAAVVLALVTKKINDFFPAAKNSDLATSPGYAPAETGFSPVASPVFLASPDALSSFPPSS